MAIKWPTSWLKPVFPWWLGRLVGIQRGSLRWLPLGFPDHARRGGEHVINSDSPDEGRYLFRNAGKVLKYTDIPEDDILKMITINPAKSLELGDRIGSIEAGKDGDIAVFDKHPLGLNHQVPDDHYRRQDLF